MKALFAALLFLWLTVPAERAVALPAPGPVSHKKLRAIDHYLQAHVATKRFTGNVLVAQDGRVVFRKSYGLADREWGIKNDRDTKFRIGSITKAFSAVLILQLAETGALRLDDRLAQHLPWYAPETAGRITLRQLLSHTSGLPNYTERTDFYQNLALLTVSPRAFGETHCQYKTLLFEPGSRFHYCNTDYYLLGLVIESATGKPYAEVLQKNLLDKAHMRHTGLDSLAAIVPHRAKGYHYGYTGWTGSYPINMATSTYAAGAVYSTVDDLLRWEKALEGTELLSEASKKLFFTPVVNHHAFGLFVNKMANGKTAIGHPGGINGFASFVIHFKEDGLYVILLANQTAGIGDLDACSAGIYAILRDQPYHLPKPPLHAALYETYAHRGVQPMLQQYQEIKDDPDYDRAKAKTFLNDFGYALLTAGRVKESLAVLKQATEEFPRDANTLDSYAEALKTDGQDALAIAYYQRILAVDPTQKAARDAIDALTEQPRKTK